jgi:hypothetical protein
MEISMLRSIQSSLSSVPAQAETIVDIGLRSTAALALVACESHSRLGTMQLDVWRSMVNGYAQAHKRWLSGEVTGDAEPGVEVLRHTMNFGSSVAGLVANTQAEAAELMESGLQEVIDWVRTDNHQGGDAAPANLPAAIHSAASVSMLTSVQALCKQLGHSAREFVANGGGHHAGAPTLAGAIHEQGQTRPRNQRKVA